MISLLDIAPEDGGETFDVLVYLLLGGCLLHNFLENTATARGPVDLWVSSICVVICEASLLQNGYSSSLRNPRDELVGNGGEQGFGFVLAHVYQASAIYGRRKGGGSGSEHAQLLPLPFLPISP